jgi:hypothetical protein
MEIHFHLVVVTEDPSTRSASIAGNNHSTSHLNVACVRA